MTTRRESLIEHLCFLGFQDIREVVTLGRSRRTCQVIWLLLINVKEKITKFHAPSPILNKRGVMLHEDLALALRLRPSFFENHNNVILKPLAKLFSCLG